MRASDVRAASLARRNTEAAKTAVDVVVEAAAVSDEAITPLTDLSGFGSLALPL